jgi:hypothetical protein
MRVLTPSRLQALLHGCFGLPLNASLTMQSIADDINRIAAND